VIYDEDDQREQLCQLVKRWREVFLDPPKRENDVFPWRAGALVFAQAFLMTAVAFKNKAFEEEREWRMVALRVPFLPDQLFEQAFRERNGMVTPFLRLPAVHSRAQPPILPITEIVMGPRQYANVSGYGLEQLLSSCGYAVGAVSVQPSSVPLRT
jgi:hypothetical protein